MRFCLIGSGSKSAAARSQREMAAAIDGGYLGGQPNRLAAIQFVSAGTLFALRSPVWGISRGGRASHAMREDDLAPPAFQPLNTDAAKDAVQPESDEPRPANAWVDCRSRLKRFVQSRLNLRLGSRIDASDIVQDTLLEASRRLRELSHLQGENLYLALRQLAYERTIDSYRRHLGAQRRSMLRERSLDRRPIDGSACMADSLVGDMSTPSRIVARAEGLTQLQDGLDKLSHNDRQILVLRYLVQLSVDEIAELLQISHTLVTTRQWRALKRLREIMEPSPVAGE